VFAALAFSGNDAGAELRGRLAMLTPAAPVGLMIFKPRL